MIQFKLLSELTMKDAAELFNKGFEGYLIPMNLTLDAFIHRMGNEGLSVEYSVVMFENEFPIGFVLQGIREASGEKISWNGGTGIIPSHRGKKLGKTLMEYAEKVLLEKGVTIASLEVLSENEPAIKLYESVGFEIKDKLHFLKKDGIIERVGKKDVTLTIDRIPALQSVNASIFYSIVPWQIDPSITPKVGGEVLLAKEDNRIIAAVLFRKRQTYGNGAEGITLFQATAEQSEKGTAALQFLIEEALEYNADIKRSTYNFPKGDGRALDLLQSSGFISTGISQLFMVKIIN